MKMLSIITPHYNCFEGLKAVYDCLNKQTSSLWEWIIVDDYSDDDLKKKLSDWVETLNDERLTLIKNIEKTNASKCRNIGATKARSNQLVFLDSDDFVSNDFVENRLIPVKDFVIYLNTGIIDKHGNIEKVKNVTGNYIDYFLQAQFIWPITAILWDKKFFFSIGGFNSELQRLQDVEMSIKALQQSNDYLVLENEVDFYYQVKPIRERKNYLKPISQSVYFLISELLDYTKLTERQLNYLTGYYYMNVKYLERFESFEHINLVKENLKLFYFKGSIGLLKYFSGKILLKLYANKVINGTYFLRINRYLFKPKTK